MAHPTCLHALALAWRRLRCRARRHPRLNRIRVQRLHDDTQHRRRYLRVTTLTCLACDRPLDFPDVRLVSYPPAETPAGALERRHGRA